MNWGLIAGWSGVIILVAVSAGREALETWRNSKHSCAKPLN